MGLLEAGGSTHITRLRAVCTTGVAIPFSVHLRIEFILLLFKTSVCEMLFVRKSYNSIRV